MRSVWPRLLILSVVVTAGVSTLRASEEAAANGHFPKELWSYADMPGAGVWKVLVDRVHENPFNLVATLIFALAIIHTFLTATFRHWAHEVEAAHKAAIKAAERSTDDNHDGHPDEVSFKGQILHFLGEVEAVFGIWAIVLIGAITAFEGWGTAVDYIGHKVNFTEAMFVVVIMAVASTRPILRLAEQCLRVVASIGKETPGAWWLSILIIAPLLGSFITEPAAMTIAALLLAHQFYEHKPSSKLCYATIGLLFVNVSVGGTLTHFAAPPVLMVATPWKWDIAFMFEHFGWRAATGIVVSTVVYYFIFRKEISALGHAGNGHKKSKDRRGDRAVPAWVTGVQLLFVAAIVLFAHYPALFIAVFLFFLAFSQATAHHQGRLDLRSPLLVGFFLGGLVVHGGLQGWWIEPVLKSLGEVPLFLSATVLTAVNDNAAITYLATLVPGFTDALKYAVVAGAVTGGGLTVIANAPNPAGQSILQRYFPEGISPLGLFLGALGPTVIMGLAFMIL
ncbi:MAG TPA: putative Na+/H+ antiporter [Rariglobus sp.]|nr:putative Na+/H+ antiporter [Rariglobus sp.]